MAKTFPLLSFLFAGNGGGNEGGDGLSEMWKYKMMMGNLGDAGGDDEFTTLAIGVPVAKRMIETIAAKIANASQETKNTLEAARTVKEMAEGMLQEDPNDDMASVLRDVSKEVITQFVFSANQGGASPLQRQVLHTNNVSMNNTGSTLISSKKKGEDTLQSIPIGEKEGGKGKKETKEKSKISARFVVG